MFPMQSTMTRGTYPASSLESGEWSIRGASPMAARCPKRKANFKYSAARAVHGLSRVNTPSSHVPPGNCALRIQRSPTRSRGLDVTFHANQNGTTATLAADFFLGLASRHTPLPPSLLRSLAPMGPASLPMAQDTGRANWLCNSGDAHDEGG